MQVMLGNGHFHRCEITARAVRWKRAGYARGSSARVMHLLSIVSSSVIPTWRTGVAGPCAVVGALFFLGCSPFNLYQQHDCYNEVTVHDRRAGDVTFDDGLGHRAAGPFVIGDMSPSRDQIPTGLAIEVDGSSSAPSQADLWVTVSLEGSPSTTSLHVTAPAPGTYSLDSLSTTVDVYTQSSASTDAGGGTSREVPAKGTVSVTSASATGCTAAFNAADQIVEACARTLVLNLTLSPSPEYPVSGGFSIDLLTKLVVVGTTTALSCVD
jgi:hypothetical protein